MESFSLHGLCYELFKVTQHNRFMNDNTRVINVIA